MRALLAFDKFKDSLSALAACEAAACALRAQHPDWELDLCPLTDGGEGFAEILAPAARGTLHRLGVTGPRGGEVEALFGLVPARQIPAAARTLLALPALPANAPVAVVELAQASGLALLPAEARDPWQTTTFGTGQLMLHAVRQLGAQAVVLGVGGSATNDLGLGALAALGLEFCDQAGVRISPPLPAAWSRLGRISGNIPRPFPSLRIACDVDNPLLGRRGAAAVYGPQKGLRATDLRRLEHESARVALMLGAHSGQPDTLMDTAGAGAAGGTAYGLLCAAGAQLVPGSALVAAWLDLDARLAAAEVVLTGEGRFDASSLTGKGPGAVIHRARRLGKPVHVFAGAADAAAAKNFPALHVITPAGTPEAAALREAAVNLGRAVRAAFA